MINNLTGNLIRLRSGSVPMTAIIHEIMFFRIGVKGEDRDTFRYYLSPELNGKPDVYQIQVTFSVLSVVLLLSITH